MAQCSDVEGSAWLVWKTAIPFKGRLRISPSFTVLGTEMYLEFVYSNYHYTKHDYEVYLRQKIDKKQSPKIFKVTSFIENPADPSSFPCEERTNTVETPRIQLYNITEQQRSDGYRWIYEVGEVRIVCLFHGGPPSMLRIKNETNELSTQTDMELQVSDLDSLSLDLSSLLEEETFPDVKMRCGDRVIPAHRSILAARSKVFSAMFRNKMTENTTGIVDVTDIEAPAFDLLLKYVYSGKVAGLTDDTALSLYVAADKYDICPLKKACSDWMIRGLTEENCVSFLTIAEMHSDVVIKDAVVSYIGGHQPVLTSEDWLKFSENNSKLAIEIYRSVFTPISK